MEKGFNFKGQSGPLGPAAIIMGKRKGNLPAVYEDAPNALELEDIQLSKRAFDALSKDPDVNARYTSFKESKVDPNKLKKFIFNKYDLTISDVSSTIIAAMCKIFVGEVIEEAREMMSKDEKGGAVTPEYLALAHKEVSKQFKELYGDNKYFCK